MGNTGSGGQERKGQVAKEGGLTLDAVKAYGKLKRGNIAQNNTHPTPTRETSLLSDTHSLCPSPPPSGQGDHPSNSPPTEPSSPSSPSAAAGANPWYMPDFGAGPTRWKPRKSESQVQNDRAAMSSKNAADYETFLEVLGDPSSPVSKEQQEELQLQDLEDDGAAASTRAGPAQNYSGAEDVGTGGKKKKKKKKTEIKPMEQWTEVGLV